MRKFLRIPKKSLVWVVVLICFFLNTAWNHGIPEKDPPSPPKFTGTKAVGPPIFTDPIPQDVTVGCIEDIPAPVSLTATDDNDPTYPKNVMSVDDPPLEGLNVCAGATITRTWTTSDTQGDNLTTIATQIITLEADVTGPVIDLTPVRDTVSCEASGMSAPAGPDRYDVWLSSLELALTTRLEDNCSGIASFTNNAPASYETDCGTLTVTFTATDNCGWSTNWQAMYTVVDDEMPVLSGVPADVNISCADPIPSVPTVTATDNCAGNVNVVMSEQNSQFIGGNCMEYTYTILRIWTATDNCGNMARDTQIISVSDQTGPDFSAPAAITLSCNDDFQDTAVTGMVSNVTDNCTPADKIIITFTDNVQGGDCGDSFVITRTWRATDRCGNVTARQQTITVRDTEGPTFDVPADLTVDCTDANNINLTGRPSNIADNCDPDADEVTFTDVVNQGNCPNNYTIRRTWRVTDRCGNATTKRQTITVRDQQKPVFTAQAKDMTITCSQGLDVDAAFSDWITNRAGATATDNCTDTDDLMWEVYNSGTITPASLAALNCPAVDGVLRAQTIDVIVTDECGMRDTTTATFQFIDDQAPVMRNCPESFSIPNDPGSCEATYALIPPVIEEDCFFATNTEDVSASATLSSQAAPGEEGSTPVDPLELNFALNGSLPINATTDATLTIDLVNVDGEEANEFFNILGEDGNLIGFTEGTGVQCGNSTSTFTIPAATLNEWAVDGIITIRLEPNIPAGMDGRFAINAICSPMGQVNGNLTFEAKDIPFIVLSYRINNLIDSTVVDPIAPIPVTLPVGDHTITYYATDCAGNSDSCVYVITVEDTEAPMLSCPPDVNLSLTGDDCEIAYTLPLPPGITDNCSVYVDGNQKLPSDTASALLTFSFDPNLTDYIADPRTISFSGVAANSLTDVTLTVDFLGDFTGNRAAMEILGENLTLLGQTPAGAANCNSPGQMVLNIPAATFNSWAADGELDIMLRPLSVPVPPGVPGDGINPCEADSVNANGETDGLSYVFLTLDYGSITPSYYTTGATVTPPTAMALPALAPTLNFKLGETEVFYIVHDLAGNPDTCSFKVTVDDPIAPEALCKPLGGLPINPSGLQVEVFDVSDVNFGSYDNCGIDTAFISPNTFTCADGGQPVTITLTVRDAAGNESSCTTTLGITLEGPEPSYNYGLCGGDSLYLFANPPSPGPEAYTYRWFRASNPGAVISTRQNPVISNIDPSFEDFYNVEITGIFNGCKAENSVFVEVNAIPLQPELVTQTTFCSSEPIVLRFQGNIPDDGDGVNFRWYEGTAPNGTLLATTNEPEYSIAPPHNLGSKRYYLEVEANGCSSRPSVTKTVNIVNRPVADITQTDSSVCAGESITLSTLVAGPTISGYKWSGPDNFNSTLQSPSVGPLTDTKAGYYYLTVARNECVSAPDSVLVTVRPKPSTPAITSNGPVCEGSSLILTTTATGASSYRWLHNNDEFISTIPSYTINSADPANGGSWQVAVTRNGCISSPSPAVNAVVNPAPDASADADPQPVCVGSAVTLMGDSDITGVTYKWTGPGIQPRFSKNPVINQATMANSGTFVLEVTSQPGCKDTATVQLDVVQGISTIDIVDDAPSCLTGPTDVHLVPSVFPVDDGTYTYTWRRNSMVFSTEKVALIPNATAADSDNYSLEVKTGNGCSSGFVTYTLDLKNAPLTPAIPSSPTGSFQFCLGNDIVLRTSDYAGAGNSITYYWVKSPGNQQTSTTVPELVIPDAKMGDSGQYSVYVVVDGCNSLNSPAVNVTVSTIPTVTAGSNSPVCEGSNIQLTAQSNLGATYAWGGPVTSSLQNPSFPTTDQIMETAEYYVIANLNGCKSDTAFVQVTVKDTPTKPMGVSNGPLCISGTDDELELTVTPGTFTPGASYRWYLTNTDNPIGAPTVNPTLVVSTFTGFSNGTHDFFVRAESDGCSSPLSNPVSVILNTVPASKAFAGRDTVLCTGNFLLRATKPAIGTGRWTLIDGDPTGVTIANPNDANSPLNGLTIDGGPYTLRWTLSNGACVDYSSDDVVVTVSSGETAQAGDNILACVDEVVNLAATPLSGNTSVGKWTQPEAQNLLGVNIVDANDPTTLIEGLEPDNVYVFTWTVTSDCGISQDQVNVTISDPIPDAGFDDIACNDQGVFQLEAARPTSGSRGRWSAANSGISFSFPDQPVTDVRGLQPGENILYWTIDQGYCGEMSTDSVTITYKKPPVVQDEDLLIDFQTPTEIDLLANDQAPAGTVAQILNGPRQGSVESLGDGRFTYTPDFNFVGEDLIVYEVVSSGCETFIATATLQVGTDAGCVAPNVITPNGDDINDTFVVPCLLDTDKYPQSQVIIFNRWGDEVFRSPLPYKNDWDGRFNGQDLPADTYYYVINFGSDEPRQTGFVVIQR
jgi:gliding motility-associated-like protein